MSDLRPLVGVTLGDVAGVGPELAARAWSEPAMWAAIRPVLVGDRGVIQRAFDRIGSSARVVRVEQPEEAEPTADLVPCLDPETVGLDDVVPGRVDARAGRAAYDALVKAIDLALAGRLDAITTLPLNKESLHAAGVRHPGHTEILAERTGAPAHAMMLYLPPAEGHESKPGLGVVHTTLHVSMREALELITPTRIVETIRLAHDGMAPFLSGERPRIAVCGLNPHAGEGGLFGEEEIEVIAPAIGDASSQGMDVHGPYPADTLFHRAVGGDFDAVVAMYHDQGHCAIKTIGFDRAVNITLGLPIVRTSVAHGTAFDIVGKQMARTNSLVEAIRAAARLALARNRV